MSAGQAPQWYFIRLSKGHYYRDSLSSYRHPLLNRNDMRHKEATLTDRRATRWAGAYRSYRKKTFYINVGNDEEPHNIFNHNI
jgi:hypothetical protein